MADPNAINSQIVAETKGLVNPIDFSGGANNADKVAILKDIIAEESTTTHRLFLDEMSPACRNSLYVILLGLEEAVTP